MAKKKGIAVEEYYAGFAIYTVAVNPGNPIEKLTEEEVKKIFLGEITNWKDVGGEDNEIKVLYRDIGQGEYDYFLEKFVNVGEKLDLAKLPSNIEVLLTQEEIIEEISKNKQAIGYYFLVSDNGSTRPLAIAEGKSGEFIKPSDINLEEPDQAYKYPILRPYYIYIDTFSPKPLKKYIEFIYSDKGLELARKMNFVPVPIKEGEVDRAVLFEFN